jgi:hypothetical protein
MALDDWLVARLRLLATAGVVGTLAGVVGVLVFAGLRTPRFASTQTFAIGALVLGFAVLGWSGSVLAGRGIETLQTYLDADTGWTERDSRRAMARIAGFGAGVMASVVVAAPLLA